jgi:glycosyltransferase involved in cell wall biosynthesis
LRILHVPHAYHPVVGGAEMLCKRVSEVLAAQGHEVQVLTTDAGAVQAYYEFGIDRIAQADQTISGVAVKRLKFSGELYRAGGWVEAQLRPRWLAQRIAGRTRQLLYKRLDRQMTKEIARIRPDVVMAMPHLVVNVLSVLAARSRLDFPLVMVPFLHEQDPNVDISATSKGLSFADAVIAQTAHEVDRLVEAYGVSRRKIFLASEGIDVAPEAVQPPKRRKRVVFLGRQVKSKGIGDLIEAMRLVWPEYPDAELAIAGIRVPESAEVDAQIVALPRADRARIFQCGTIADEEKDNFLQSARCLVLPSKNESFGMVILEAWARARPVVTWDLPVFRSTVDDGITGLLADPHGGPRALAQAIRRILEKPDEADRMGMSGYKLAKSAHSWSNVAATYLDAYRYAIRTAERNDG